MNDKKPITLLVCALGGEGGGVLSEWLVDVARHAGYAAQATSIPGVAQRTGATTYYLEVFSVPLAGIGGRMPVFSLNPVPGELDAIVSSELLETARQVGNGMTHPQRTLVITSTARSLTVQERMQLGDGRVDDASLLQVVKSFSRDARVFDMNAAAKEAGTIVSAVMLGAIAGSGVLPFARADYEAVVKGEANLRGFASGFAACHPGLDAGSLAMDEARTSHGQRPRIESGVTGQAWPASVGEFAFLGTDRLKDYQGPSYAALYEERLRKVLAIDESANHATTRETARWLALWMAFDDIVRVADLKSRATRWERVQREVKAKDDDLLRVYDHFKPGAPEFAALLPPSLSQRVLAWDRARVAKGREPWALPLKVGTHSVFGMLALRTLANMKWLRVKGGRYALEQAMIERWLAGIAEGARHSARLAHEVALCGRLVKGYGATNERAKENLLHVLDHMLPLKDAGAIAAAREAALADDAGRALDATLVKHGAPSRPVKEQPIRWMRKPGATATGAMTR